MYQWVSIGSGNGLSPVRRQTITEPMLTFISRILRNKLRWISNQNTKLLIHENAYENGVCEMASVVPRGDELTTQFYLSISYKVQSNFLLICVYNHTDFHRPCLYSTIAVLITRRQRRQADITEPIDEIILLCQCHQCLMKRSLSVAPVLV